MRSEAQLFAAETLLVPHEHPPASWAQLSVPAGARIWSSLPAASLCGWCRGSPAPGDGWQLSSHLCSLLSSCREHGGGGTTNTTYPLARGEEFLTWMHALSNCWVEQYLSHCGCDGDNDVAGKTTLETRCMAGGQWSGERKKQCKQKKEVLQQAKWDSRERFPSGTSDPAKHRLQFVLWREVKTLVHSAHGPKSLGNEPFCCPLLEPVLVLQGWFCHPNTAGEEQEKQLNLLHVFWCPSSRRPNLTS